MNGFRKVFIMGLHEKMAFKPFLSCCWYNLRSQDCTNQEVLPGHQPTALICFWNLPPLSSNHHPTHHHSIRHSTPKYATCSCTHLVFHDFPASPVLPHPHHWTISSVRQRCLFLTTGSRYPEQKALSKCLCGSCSISDARKE